MKTCTKCGVKKPLSDFYKDNRRKHPYCARCKKCHNELTKQSHVKNPEARKRFALKSKYNISLQEFDQLKENQNHKCAICNTPLIPGNSTHIDHSHKTGKVRGILCNPCNRGIGYLKDSTEILESALEYLKKYN